MSLSLSLSRSAPYYTYLPGLIQIRMNGLDEIMREYVQIKEDGKALNVTDIHIHT